MNINKKMAGSIATALVVLGGVGVGITVHNNSLANQLQNHKWNLIQDSQSYPTQFKKTKMIAHSAIVDVSLDYKLEKANGKQYIILSDSDIKNQKYTISKSDDGYIIKPANKVAKADHSFGGFELIER